MRFGRLCVVPWRKVGCRIIGLDINKPGVRNANQLALAKGLASRVRFEQCDASEKLPFDDNTFDAVFSNDVLCHLPGRSEVLVEMFRVLKPSGRMLFSDALNWRNDLQRRDRYA